MSNATQDSRNSGDNRRRRSRGGQNRRNNNTNEDRRGGDRGSRDGQQGRGRRPEGAQADFHPQSPRPARKYSAPKLTWWQKILKAIGLYKEPARPARPERKPEEGKSSGVRPEREPRAPKSNTRNARSGDTPVESRPAEHPERQRGERGERNRGGERARGGERSRGGDRDRVDSPRVYVGNLSYDVTEQDLQELFKGIGGVRNVEIVYNRSTHRSKGYGFVEMLHMDEAKRAVEVLHDQHFMGRKMNVSGAKSKGNDEREDQEERQERPASRPALAERAPQAAAVGAEAPFVDPQSTVEEPQAAIVADTPAASVMETLVSEETPIVVAEGGAAAEEAAEEAATSPEGEESKPDQA